MSSHANDSTPVPSPSSNVFVTPSKYTQKPYLYPLENSPHFSDPRSPLTPPLTPAYTIQPLQPLRYNNGPLYHQSQIPTYPSYNYLATPSSSSQSGTESALNNIESSPSLTFLSTPRSINQTALPDCTDFGVQSNYSISTDGRDEEFVYAGVEQCVVPPVDGNLDAVQAPGRFLFVSARPFITNTSVDRSQYTHERVCSGRWCT